MGLYWFNVSFIFTANIRRLINFTFYHMLSWHLLNAFVLNNNSLQPYGVIATWLNVS